MKTTDQLVRELIDREAIRDLAIRASDYQGRGDVESLVNLFTEDAAFTARDPENEVVTRGRGELKKMFDSLISDVHPRPFIHTHVVELRGVNSAVGRCTVELRTAKIDVRWLGTGCYEDEYVKVGEDWKIASRRLTELSMSVPLGNFVVR